MKKFWILGIAVAMGVWMGCAVSPYRQAEMLIAQKEYRQALRIYLQALHPRMVNGKRVVDYDPEAMTGIGMVLFHLKRYRTASNVLAQVTRRTPNYGKALYYLAGCYENLNRPDKASEIYQQYTSLDESDPYREILRWRSEWLSHQRMTQEIQRAMTEEPSPSITSIPKGTVAVLYFQDLSKNTFSPFQKGLTQLLIEDLSGIASLKVIPRAKIQRLVEITQWKPKDLVEDTRAEQIGNLLSARTLVKGTYRISSDQQIEIRMATVNLPESTTPKYHTFQGQVSDILSLEKRMVRAVIGDLGIKLSGDEERAVLTLATRDFTAFTYFCYGLNDMDGGKFDSAQRNFQKALQQDPDFFLVHDWVVDPELYRATRQSQFATLNQFVETQVGIGGKPSRGPERGIFAVNSMGRLQEFGTLMDAGFMPGNDSRKLTESGLWTQGGWYPTLSNPPGPPFTPSRWILPGPPNPPGRP